MMVFIRIQGVSTLPCLQNKFRTKIQNPFEPYLEVVSRVVRSKVNLGLQLLRPSHYQP